MNLRAVVLARMPLVAMALALAACTTEPEVARPDGRDAIARGRVALQTYGCGACHRIPGIDGANGVVGPPLVDMRRRVYLARGVPNTPEAIARWIREPQAIAPGTVMPDLKVDAGDAMAMTAYLRSVE